MIRVAEHHWKQQQCQKQHWTTFILHTMLIRMVPRTVHNHISRRIYPKQQSPSQSPNALLALNGLHPYPETLPATQVRQPQDSNHQAPEQLTKSLRLRSFSLTAKGITHRTGKKNIRSTIHLETVIVGGMTQPTARCPAEQTFHPSHCHALLVASRECRNDAESHLHLKPKM